MSAPKRVHLAWSGRGLVFDGRTPKGSGAVLDGDGEEGPSSTDMLLLGLAGCMGIDVLTILQKSRVPVTSLDVSVEGDRAESHPRRFTHIRIEFRVAGPGDQHRTRLDRAVQLSRDKYCSVLQSLRTDIEFEIEVARV